MTIKWIPVIILMLIISNCKNEKSAELICEENLEFAEKQTEKLCKVAIKNNRIPRTISADGDLHWTNQNFDWTEGFFPGSCWYLYEYSDNISFKKSAEELQKSFKSHRFYTNNHDLGFVFNCSYGNDYRLTGNEDSKQVLIDAGNSLLTRFNPAVGCIQSWDVDGGWQAKRGWEFPVIIDNMMNLELLFELSDITGDSKYKDVAITHANTTLLNHFREDGSSYHVIDYDTTSGKVRCKETAQGYAHESAWARGQAWGLYGYTVCYRYTKDEKYLEKAKDIARFIFTNKNLPSDFIPYWDFNAPKGDSEFRDASAAAIIASALIELNQYTTADYLSKGRQIVNNLSLSNYRAESGSNFNFILKHSVGSIPHNNEIDVPLVYADYYYIEALMRLHKAEKKS